MARAYTSQKVVEYQLWPLLDGLKIKRAGLHAFRHAHTTLLLEVASFAQGGTTPAPSCRRESDIEHLCSSVEGTHREAVEKLLFFWSQVVPMKEETHVENTVVCGEGVGFMAFLLPAQT